MRLAPLVLLAACAHFPHGLEKPSAQVESVQIGPGVGGLAGVVDLAVTNPNPVGVPLRTVDWQLWIGDASSIGGRIELSQTIPARGTAPVRAVIVVAAGQAITAAALLAKGERRYRISGTMTFSTSLGPLGVVFESNGELGG